MSTELRPTPETDAAFWHGGVAVDADFARKLERERDDAKTLNRTLLDQLEAQAVQIEAMRDAIKEAHEALMLAPYRDQEALAKLQPFLP